jgi:hypothetical protein
LTAFIRPVSVTGWAARNNSSTAAPRACASRWPPPSGRHLRLRPCGVPAFPDRDAVPGALAQLAARVAADARQLAILAVACERSRGASWEAITGALGLGDGAQAARDLYLPALAKLDQVALEGWILGDDPQFTGIPGRVGGTAAAAQYLDSWVTGRQATADGPDRLFSVSGHLTR